MGNYLSRFKYLTAKKEPSYPYCSKCWKRLTRQTLFTKNQGKEICLPCDKECNPHKYYIR